MPLKNVKKGKDTNFAIGLHSEHSRQSLLFFFLFLSNNYADPDLSVLTVTVKLCVYITLFYANSSGHQLRWYTKVTITSANSSAHRFCKQLGLETVVNSHNANSPAGRLY